MTDNERFDEAISRWLEETAPARIPERVLNATFERTRRTRQPVGWRALLGRPQMLRFATLAGSAAVLVIAGVLALNLYLGGPGIGGPSPTATLAPSPTLAPSTTPSPSAGSEANAIIAAGNLDAFAVTEGGALLTMWGNGCGFGGTDCEYAWRLGEGAEALATGVVRPDRAVFDSGDVFVPVGAGEGFVLVPPKGQNAGLRIAADGTASSISMSCADVGWSTPTEQGRLTWITGLQFVDGVAGRVCPISRLGGRSLAPGVFTPEGTLWSLVDNEVGPPALTIARYDGAEWTYHDFATEGGAWTSVIAASGSTVVVLIANHEPSPTRDLLMGVAVSTDSGATWNEVVDRDVLDRDLPFSNVLSPNSDAWYSGYTSMAFAGPDVLYVADGRGDLWRSTDLTTFSRVPVTGGVQELRPAGGAVIGRSKDNPNELVRILADGTVEAITAR